MFRHWVQGVDLTKSDDEEPDTSSGAQLRKKLGIPEPDPDALPSSLINKYLKLARTYTS